MNPTLKRFLIFLAVLVVIGIGLASAIAYFNEDRIRSMTIEALNEALDTEVKVESIEFSLLKRFPKASIHFRNVQVLEKVSSREKGNFLEGRSLFLEFDPFDLITGAYVVNQISLEDGILNIRYFRDGTNNFDFFKQSGEKQEFQIALEKVLLLNSQISYRDDVNSVYFANTSEKLMLSGEFSARIYDLSLFSAGTMHSFRVNDFRAGKEHEFDLDISLRVDRDENSYTIRKASTRIGPFDFTYNGSFQRFENYTSMDLSVSAENFLLDDLFYLLPKKSETFFEHYRAKGQISMSGSLKGNLSSTESPLANFEFSISDGELNHTKSKTKLKDISFQGNFTNGKRHSLATSQFNLTDLQFEGNHGKSKGELSIRDFNKPIVTMDLESALDLGQLKGMIQNDSLEEIGGQCSYSIHGEVVLDSLSKFDVNDLKKTALEGAVRLDNGFIRWKAYKHRVEDINAKARLGKNMVYIDSLTYTIQGMKAHVDGVLQNFLPYLFFENEVLMALGNVHYESLDVNELMDAAGSGEGKKGFILPVSELVDLNLKLSTESFAFRKFRAQNLSCEIVSAYPKFAARSLRFNAMEGSFAGWMTFNLADLESVLTSGQLQISSVDIRQLFEQCENFGQDNILSQNLEGVANAEIDFKAKLKRDFTIDQESIEAFSHIEIRKGRLIDYKPILALSKYVEVDELNDIQFSRLTNDIQVKNRTVLIPEMEIESSALEVILSGRHTFDNEIDYHFQLWLNDFLFRKAKKNKKRKEEFGEIEEDESGGAKLFIRMTGTVDDYKIRLDRKALREKWREDMQSEKEELKQLFREEFTKEKNEDKEKPMSIGIEWDEFEESPKSDSVKSQEEEKKIGPPVKEEKKKKDSWVEKLGKKVEDEYEEYDPDKFE